MPEHDSNDISSLLFTQLVMSFQAAAWQQLGKTVSPFSGKVERNLELAKNSIDILGMLETKTKGNLSDDERDFLKNVLTQLRMNYVEEINKPQPEQPADDKQADNQDSKPDNPEEDGSAKT